MVQFIPLSQVETQCSLCCSCMCYADEKPVILPEVHSAEWPQTDCWLCLSLIGHCKSSSSRLEYVWAVQCEKMQEWLIQHLSEIQWFVCLFYSVQCLDVCLMQRFSIPVLAPSRSAYFACLSLLTHLIKIISLLEVCSMHELCSDWHAPYTGSIAPYSLSRGNPLKFTSFRNIHSWICAVQRLHARTSVTSYTSVIQFEFTSCTLICTLNGIYIRSLRTGIMAEYPVMSTSQGTCVRIEQTSEAIRVTYEICRAGGREDWNWEPLA